MVWQSFYADRIDGDNDISCDNNKIKTTLTRCMPLEHQLSVCMGVLRLTCGELGFHHFLGNSLDVCLCRVYKVARKWVDYLRSSQHFQPRCLPLCCTRKCTSPLQTCSLTANHTSANEMQDIETKAWQKTVFNFNTLNASFIMLAKGEMAYLNFKTKCFVVLFFQHHCGSALEHKYNSDYFQTCCCFLMEFFNDYQGIFWIFFKNCT